MTTLKDIAKLAGVSVSTASRALNDSPLVNEQTKWKVREAAASLNYIPNLNAASLRTGRSDIIVYAVPRLEGNQDALHFQILGQLERAAALLRHKILLAAYPSGQRLRQFLQVFARDTRTGGMLLFGEVFDQDCVSAFQQVSYPLVIVNAYPDAWEQWDGLACVGVDNLEAGYLAAKHLIWLGHRRLAWIGEATSREALQRREGFRRALVEAALEVRAEWMVRTEPGHEIDDGARSTYRLLGEPTNGPTGFVAGDDLIALGVIRGAQSRGLRVPGQISVIGFGDFPWGSAITPALTTMDVKAKVMGRQAVDLLMRLMRGRGCVPPAERQIRLRPELIVRDSAVAPGHSAACAGQMTG
ncbi:MAG: LacI family DNA-binding transcriptional regulator [Candidatus Sumerlaeia bacterium]